MAMQLSIGRHLIASAVFATFIAVQPTTAQNHGEVSPGKVADELLALDRAFSAASEKTDLVSGISAMFAPDVAMPIPGNVFTSTAAEAITALKGNPDNPKSVATWTPIRVGVSGDGLHGFTFGYMTVRKPDGSLVPAKYMSYWVKTTAGWRVAAYKRAGRPAGDVSLAMIDPALPKRLVSPVRDSTVVAKLGQSLDAAERSFSDEAQKIGMGAAFTKYGSDDAVNMGGGAEFIRGAAAIGSQGLAPGEKAPVFWAPDRVIVASSGDFGVTLGKIRSNDPPAAGQEPKVVFAFFTIWRRASLNDPWRYVAE